ncbi:MAG: hypothetical protein WBO10_07775 [Pyrinomonadaceae bacterium]
MTTQATSAETGLLLQDDFLAYPLYKVVTVFKDHDHVVPAVRELQAAGFSEADIEAFCGVDGEKRLDFEGTRHGVWATFLRAVQHVGPDRTYLERYEQHLQDGDCMIMVKVTKKEEKELAAEILHRHTDERVTYFGLLMVDEIQ